MNTIKINLERPIRQNTGAILNPAACGNNPTRNILSIGFGNLGVCDYFEVTTDPIIPSGTDEIFLGE